MIKHAGSQASQEPWHRHCRELQGRVLMIIVQTSVHITRFCS
jgi:hypothetical protein